MNGSEIGMHGGRPWPPPTFPLPKEYELSDLAGGLSMNRLLLKLAMMVVIGGLLYSTPVATQESPTTKNAASVRIIRGPEIERVDPDFAIVRWTSNNPGGSPEHYGVVYYGTNPRERRMARAIG